ncbi:MAG: HesA/MoeB/ThiF family protein [Magnetococcales bacterium]|nr:HesA/MoeB/ThiF family protein [Magnetococcales bacterium]
MPRLTERSLQRYSRQILLKEVGGSGQQRLMDATVLVVGVGGLGSPAALYLAASGVGRLILADGDAVERSNLGRQVIHTTDSIGQNKVRSAARTIRALNPEIEIVPVERHVDRESLPALVERSDLVLDGSDAFSVRYLANAVCHQLGRPYVFGAVSGFEGQVGVSLSGVESGSPCYRCLFPSVPQPGEEHPTCAAAAVLGPLPGVIGTMQATEALKILLRIGTPLAGALMLFNALDGITRRIGFSADPGCSVCGAPVESNTPGGQAS